MQLRRTLAATGVAALMVTGLAVPAQAADWKSYGRFTTKSKCLDAGSQYVREGFHEYKCTYDLSYPPYILWLR